MSNTDGDQLSASSRLSRRKFATVAAGLAGALVAGAGIEAVSAGRSWCRFDPVIMVDGQLADIFVGSYVEMLLSATGPVKLNISIPSNSSGSVILMDAGFGHGYTIKFIKTTKLKRTSSKTPIIIDAYAPAKDSSLPFEVTFAPRSLDSSVSSILFGMTKSGYANRWLRLAP